MISIYHHTFGVRVGTMKHDARQRISKSFIPISGTQNQLENENAKCRRMIYLLQANPLTKSGRDILIKANPESTWSPNKMKRKFSQQNTISI